MRGVRRVIDADEQRADDVVCAVYDAVRRRRLRPKPDADRRTRRDVIEDVERFIVRHAPVNKESLAESGEPNSLEDPGNRNGRAD